MSRISVAAFFSFAVLLFSAQFAFAGDVANTMCKGFDPVKDAPRSCNDSDVPKGTCKSDGVCEALEVKTQSGGETAPEKATGDTSANTGAATVGTDQGIPGTNGSGAAGNSESTIPVSIVTESPPPSPVVSPPSTLQQLSQTANQAGLTSGSSLLQQSVQSFLNPSTNQSIGSLPISQDPQYNYLAPANASNGQSSWPTATTYNSSGGFTTTNGYTFSQLDGVGTISSDPLVVSAQQWQTQVGTLAENAASYGCAPACFIVNNPTTQSAQLFADDSGSFKGAAVIEANPNAVAGTSFMSVITGTPNTAAIATTLQNGVSVTMPDGTVQQYTFTPQAAATIAPALASASGPDQTNFFDRAYDYVTGVSPVETTSISPTVPTPTDQNTLTAAAPSQMNVEIVSAQEFNQMYPNAQTPPTVSTVSPNEVVQSSFSALEQPQTPVAQASAQDTGQNQSANQSDQTKQESTAAAQPNQQNNQAGNAGTQTADQSQQTAGQTAPKDQPNAAPSNSGGQQVADNSTQGGATGGNPSNSGGSSGPSGISGFLSGLLSSLTSSLASSPPTSAQQAQPAPAILIAQNQPLVTVPASEDGLLGPCATQASANGQQTANPCGATTNTQTPSGQLVALNLPTPQSVAQVSNGTSAQTSGPVTIISGQANAQGSAQTGSGQQNSTGQTQASTQTDSGQQGSALQQGAQNNGGQATGSGNTETQTGSSGASNGQGQSAGNDTQANPSGTQAGPTGTVNPTGSQQGGTGQAAANPGNSTSPPSNTNALGQASSAPVQPTPQTICGFACTVGKAIAYVAENPGILLGISPASATEITQNDVNNLKSAAQKFENGVAAFANTRASGSATTPGNNAIKAGLAAAHYLENNLGGTIAGDLRKFQVQSANLEKAFNTCVPASQAPEAGIGLGQGICLTGQSVKNVYDNTSTGLKEAAGIVEAKGRQLVQAVDQAVAGVRPNTGFGNLGTATGEVRPAQVVQSTDGQSTGGTAQPGQQQNQPSQNNIQPSASSALPGLKPVPPGTASSATNPIVTVKLPNGTAVSYQAQSPQIAATQAPVQAWLAKNISSGALPANTTAAHYVAKPAANGNYDIYDQKGTLVKSGASLPASTLLSNDSAVTALNLNSSSALASVKGNGTLTVSSDNTVSRVAADGTQTKVGTLIPTTLQKMIEQNNVQATTDKKGNFTDTNGNKLAVQATYNGPVIPQLPSQPCSAVSQTCRAAVAQEAYNIVKSLGYKPSDLALGSAKYAEAFRTTIEATLASAQAHGIRNPSLSLGSAIGILRQETDTPGNMSEFTSPTGVRGLMQVTMASANGILGSQSTFNTFQGPWNPSNFAREDNIGSVITGMLEFNNDLNSYNGNIAAAAQTYNSGSPTGCVGGGCSGGAPTYGQSTARDAATISNILSTCNNQQSCISQGLIQGLATNRSKGAQAIGAITSIIEAPIGGATVSGNSTLSNVGTITNTGNPAFDSNSNYQLVSIASDGTVTKIGGSISSATLGATGAGTTALFVSTDANGTPDGSMQTAVSTQSTDGSKGVILAVNADTGAIVLTAQNQPVAYDPTTSPTGTWNPTNDTYTVDTNPPAPTSTANNGGNQTTQQANQNCVVVSTGASIPCQNNSPSQQARPPQTSSSQPVSGSSLGQPSLTPLMAPQLSCSLTSASATASTSVAVSWSCLYGTPIPNGFSTAGAQVGQVNVPYAGAAQQFLLTCVDPTGVQPPSTTAQCSVAATSTPATPAVAITATPATVGSGKTTTVSWSSVGVSSCSVMTSSGYTIGTTTKGSVVSPILATTTAFTAQCQSLTGSSVSTSTSVIVQ